MDDSRPAPGPFTRTSSWRTPCSRAAAAHCWAAIWAAKGVPFRDPLNPHRPAEDQDRRFPCWSVTATTVLLNVAWTCATASGTFFFSFFFAARLAGAFGLSTIVSRVSFPDHFFPVAFFFPAMAT